MAWASSSGRSDGDIVDVSSRRRAGGCATESPPTSSTCGCRSTNQGATDDERGDVENSAAVTRRSRDDSAAEGRAQHERGRKRDVEGCVSLTFAASCARSSTSAAETRSRTSCASALLRAACASSARRSELAASAAVPSSAATSRSTPGARNARAERPERRSRPPRRSTGRSARRHAWRPRLAPRAAGTTNAGTAPGGEQQRSDRQCAVGVVEDGERERDDAEPGPKPVDRVRDEDPAQHWPEAWRADDTWPRYLLAAARATSVPYFAVGPAQSLRCPRWTLEPQA